MIAELAAWLTEFVHSLGILGLFVASFLESTFVPIPSEATMIPAGYLVQQGHWGLAEAWGAAITGTILGSLFNYALAHYMGRPLLARFGKYMFFGPERMAQLDNYFAAHGEISILTGRFIPGIRHVISFPAGLANMDLKRFTMLTALGGGIWMTILLGVGYAIGGNKDLVHHYMHIITAACITGVAIVIAYYIRQHKRRALA